MKSRLIDCSKCTKPLCWKKNAPIYDYEEYLCFECNNKEIGIVDWR